MESEATADDKANGQCTRKMYYTMQCGNGRRPESAICITIRFYHYIELLSPTADISTQSSKEIDRENISRPSSLCPIRVRIIFLFFFLLRLLYPSCASVFTPSTVRQIGMLIEISILTLRYLSISRNKDTRVLCRFIERVSLKCLSRESLYIPEQITDRQVCTFAYCQQLLIVSTLIKFVTLAIIYTSASTKFQSNK